ncbi:ABC transporter ATP-binding protein [Knoellia subterranea]|uniref:ABC transporter n=1 Tax=Knoellia subterranea KCTC 19937 TaxID=1385521 RepID=A0A0A0JLR0_9MICO|nr:ABC transporter ATP-binding protein [Knoellia subterranea]KGN37704.1 ABC transporter [Knoellia subterranea KCTC 19937]
MTDNGEQTAYTEGPKAPAGGDRETLLEITGLSKSFGTVHANRDISLRVDRGEIVALLGENGAGKSTLVKQIFGLITPDAGTISIKGDATKIKDPKDAIRRGIGMVHQHFQLVPVMTVAENMMLGHETVKGGVLDLDGARQMVRELSTKHKLSVDPDAEIEDLPVGTQQRVEILKALSRKVDLLILDEPTAVLTPQETDELLGVMKELAAGGTSIVFITHKLREVLAAADRCYVLRQGQVVGGVDDLTSTTTSDLASMMVGRDVVLRVDKAEATPGDTVLSIKGLQVRDDRGLPAVDGFDLDVRAGEIVGLAGVEGNGQRELVESIAGMRPSIGGTVSLAGEDITRSNARDTNNAGVGHVPEDREKHGIVGGYSIADNLVLNRYDEEPFAHGFRRDFGAVREHAVELREEFDIRSPDVEAPAGSLSGGNKQKVVVAREMSAKPQLLMAAQPTRGVDVGSIEFIHRRIVEARDAGAAVLLVSAELDEILSLSDRIAVIHGGKVVAEVAGKDADRTEIGRLMAGDSDHH